MRKVAFPAGCSAGVIDAPVPAPGPGQMLVRTEAVGVGVGLVRMLEAGDAARPGGEMVGTVVTAGPDVAGFETGDRVGGVVFDDVYAEVVLADPRLVSHVPAGTDAAVALALVRGGLVALSTLRAGHVAPGKFVLVTAAASGTGHLAVQLARALGAVRAVATVGPAGKAGFARQCGADEVVTYPQPSWGDPVDLVLDGVGGELHARRRPAGSEVHRPSARRDHQGHRPGSHPEQPRPGRPARPVILRPGQQRDRYRVLSA
jgi:NADPH:quinone reductase